MGRMPFKHKMSAPKMPKMKMKMDMSGPSDLSTALRSARPGKASRLSTIRTKFFGKGGE